MQPAMTHSLPVCRRNLWPGQDLPELEPAFRRLGQLIIAVGQLLAAHCDAYVARMSGTKAAGRLQQIISDSPCPKVAVRSLNLPARSQSPFLNQ